MNDPDRTYKSSTKEMIVSDLGKDEGRRRWKRRTSILTKLLGGPLVVRTHLRFANWRRTESKKDSSCAEPMVQHSRLG